MHTTLLSHVGSVALLLRGVVTAAHGQAVQDSVPQRAYSVAAAFDASRGRLVVFGGFNGRYIGDTWEWDGSAWTRFRGNGPSARNAPALAYDAAHNVIVMFGGDTRSTGALGDTWLFDGAQWRLAATTGPPARATHAMAYDAARQRVVLFGGSNGDEMLGDTWEWDGARWTQVASGGPSARTLYGLTYDAKRGRTVLFGGTSRLAPDAPSHADTWEWDGARWTQINVSGPSGRDHVAMAYDPAHGRVVLHGGGYENASRETWAYDGTSWTQISDAGPRRRFAQLTFNTTSRSLLLYGGFDRQPSNELWVLGTTWTRVFPN